MDALDDRLAGARNVLVAGPSLGGSRERCSTLLRPDGPADHTIFVTFTRDVEDCVGQWDAAGDGAGTATVITVGAESARPGREDVTTEAVGSPSDLTGLGITLGDALSGRDGSVAVCVDSLTSMLQYVDFETAYEFLHTVTGQFDAAGARAHFHVDPAAHEPQQVAALTSLMDARLEVDGEDVRIRTRDLLG